MGNQGYAQGVQQKSTMKVKDTLFRKLFSDRVRAIELCNALEGTDYPQDSKTRIYDLENSLMRRFSDSIIGIEDQLLVFSEQQSIFNPNMPLRLLSHVTDTLFSWHVDMKEIYKPRLFKIPTPKFYVLYNGRDRIKQDVLLLSDAFKLEAGQYKMELPVKVLDVGYTSGNVLLNKSPSLGGYAYLIEQIRCYEKELGSRDKAIKPAIKKCIAEGILADFLKENLEEVAEMLAYEYDQELEHQALLEEGLEKGLVNAAIKMIRSGMGLREVANILELTDRQISRLEQGTAL